MARTERAFIVEKFIKRAQEVGIEAKPFKGKRGRPHAVNAAQVGYKLVYLKSTPNKLDLYRFQISPEFKHHNLYDFIAFLTPTNTYIISTAEISVRDTEFVFDPANKNDAALERWEELRREYERRR